MPLSTLVKNKISRGNRAKDVLGIPDGFPVPAEIKPLDLCGFSASAASSNAKAMPYPYAFKPRFAGLCEGKVRTVHSPEDHERIATLKYRSKAQDSGKVVGEVIALQNVMRETLRNTCSREHVLARHVHDNDFLDGLKRLPKLQELASLTKSGTSELKCTRTKPLSPHRNAILYREEVRMLADDGELFPSSMNWSAHEGMYTQLSTLVTALNSESTILLRASWILNLCNHFGILPRRQELSADASWEPVAITEIASLASKLPTKPIVAISYCWITASHPDPNGAQIQIIGEACRLCLSEFRVFSIFDLAIFMDWGSLHQHPRTAHEQLLFKDGLKHVNLWYAHGETQVWLLTHSYLGSHPYMQRGWPCFENAVSCMITSPWQLIDLGLFAEDSEGCKDWSSLCEHCSATRQPPMLPRDFSEFIEAKKFTNGADVDFVKDKYRKTFDEVIKSPSTLVFSGLGWQCNDFQSLARLFPECPNLEELILDENQVGSAGAEALAQQLPRCKKLARLSLSRCQMEGRDCIKVAGAWLHCPNLHHLYLDGNPLQESEVEAVLRCVTRLPSKGIPYMLRVSASKADSDWLVAAWVNLHRDGILKAVLGNDDYLDFHEDLYAWLDDLQALCVRYSSKGVLLVGGVPSADSVKANQYKQFVTIEVTDFYNGEEVKNVLSQPQTLYSSSHKSAACRQKRQSPENELLCSQHHIEGAHKKTVPSTGGAKPRRKDECATKTGFAFWFAKLMAMQEQEQTMSCLKRTTSCLPDSHCSPLPSYPGVPYAVPVLGKSVVLRRSTSQPFLRKRPVDAFCCHGRI